MTLAARLSAIDDRIADAARRAGRDPGDITRIVVTKFHPAQLVRDLRALGVTEVGENRQQELTAKRADLVDLDDVRWHFIGHLQTNKVRQVVGNAVLVHSVDSWRLASAVDAQARSRDLVQGILVQVNTSGEPSKQGLSPAELPAVLRRIHQELPGVRLEGLMTMAPYTADPEETRPFFKRLRQLRDESNAHLPADRAMAHLSMGMSRDYAVAVEEGATIIRIGTGLFGAR